MKIFIYRTTIYLFSLAIITPSFACSVVFDNNNSQAMIVARTMDLYVSDLPSLVVLPKGIERKGNGGENSLQWRSKYGSVVVTAFHTDAVSDGMNEKGFAVHLLYQHATQYENRDLNKPAVSNALWVQYLLDNYATVNQAVEASRNFQVVSTKIFNKEWPLHIAMEDASGDSAIIEFINGKMKIDHGHQYRVMTNEPPFNIQLRNLKRYKLFGGNLSMPGDVDPLSRFVRASSYLKTLPSPKNYHEALAGVVSVIRTVMVPFGAEDTSGSNAEDAWPTRWITIADLTDRFFYFHSTSSPNIIWLDFAKLNFAKGTPKLVIDPTNNALVGEVSSKLQPYAH